MAEIIQFKQSEDYYIEQSVSWSGRGDHFKSLLYARSANESGSLRSHMRLSQALYESGNFERSAESYLSLYAGGLRSGELYAGIIKSLAAMSRFRSAAFFVKEARDCGALENMPSGDVLSRGEFNRALADIIRKYRDASQPSAFARTLYIVSRGDVSADDTFIYDLYLSEGDNAATDALFRSASVLTKDKLNRPLAQKLLSACDETLSSGEPRQDVLAAKIIALVSLDRLEEADAVADDLLAMELPESDLDMLKCGIAMLELGYYEGALDYLEELTNEVFDETLLSVTALAELAAGDAARAREMFSEVLIIDPRNVAATYWCGRLAEPGPVERPSSVDKILPDDERSRLRSELLDLIEDAGVTSARLHGKGEMGYLRDYAMSELCGKDRAFAAALASDLASRGLFRSVVNKYLLMPEGNLSVKRAAIAELFALDGKTPVTVFLFGMRRVSATLDLGRLGCFGDTARVYAELAAAYAVYGDGRTADDLFVHMYPLVAGLNINGRESAASVAAAMALADGLFSMTTVREAANMFGVRSTDDISSYRDLIADTYPEYKRSGRGRKKKG